MTRLPTQNLQKKDTIMVEATIGRYRLKTQGDSVRMAKTSGWTEWRAFLDLRCISLIHRDLASVDIPDDIEDEVL